MERKTQYKHRAKNVAKIRQRHKEEELGKVNLDNSNKKYSYPSDVMFIMRTCFVLSTTVICMQHAAGILVCDNNALA